MSCPTVPRGPWGFQERIAYRDAPARGFSYAFNIDMSCVAFSSKIEAFGDISAGGVTVGGLKAGKRYYVRVRPLRKALGRTYTGTLCSYRAAR